MHNNKFKTSKVTKKFVYGGEDGAKDIDQVRNM